MRPYNWLDNAVRILKLFGAGLFGICIVIGPVLVIVGAIGVIVYLFAIAPGPAMIGVLAFSICLLTSVLIKRGK